MIMDDEAKIEMIRWATSSMAGWDNLAESILGNHEPEKARQECHRLFGLMSKTAKCPEESYFRLERELDIHLEQVRKDPSRASYYKVGSR